MVRRLGWFLVACLLFLPAATAAAGEEVPAAEKAAEIFESLYGKQVRQVTASADRNDDAALAGKLLEAARAAEATPGLLGVLCENAYTLGLRHPDGHKTAIGAMDLLAEKVPGQRLAALDKLVDFHQTQYNRARSADRRGRGEVLFDAIARAANTRAGAKDFAGAAACWRRALPIAKIAKPALADSVQLAVKLAESRLQAMASAAALRQRLKANADDKQARDALVTLYIVEFDDPAEAAKCLTPERSDMLSKLVMVAGMSVERLPLRACLELGDWYRRLSEKATETSTGPMLRHARHYYRRYLELHTVEDLSRTRVKLALNQIEAELVAYPSLAALAVGKRAPVASGPVGAKPGGAMSDLALVTRPSPLPGVVSWTIETRQPRGFILAVAFSPDGKHLAAAGDTGTIRLLEAQDGSPVRMMLGHNGQVRGLAFSPDGKTLASASSDRTIRLWDVASGLQVNVLEGHKGSVNAVAWSQDGKMLASAGSDKTVGLWDVASGKMTRSLEGAEYGVRSVVFTPDGKSVVSAGYRVRFWDLGTGQERPTAEPISGRALAVSPDGKTLAIGHGRGTTLLDLATLTPCWKSERAYGGVSSVAFASSGQLLAVGSVPPAILNARSGEVVRGFDAKGDAVDAVTYSPDGRFLAACIRENRPPTVMLRVWDPTSGECVWDVTRALKTLGKAAVSPDRKWLACADGQPLTVRFWNLQHGVLLQVLEPGSTYSTYALAWSPTGKVLAMASYEAGVRYLDIRTGRWLKTFGSGHTFYSLAWSPDGKVLAAHQRKGPLELWNAVSCRLAGKVPGTAGAGPWSPDGRRLACPTSGGGIAVVDGRAGRVLQTLQAVSRKIKIGEPAWSPDGRFLAAGEEASRQAEFCSVYIYDAKTWQVAASMKAAESGQGTTALDWSRDGAQLAAGDTTGTIHLWDASGKPVGEMRHPMGQVDLLAWLPDGRLLAGYGRLARVWDLAAGRPVRTFMAVGRKDGITFADSGHFAATAGVEVEKDFLYVVRGNKGIRLLTPTAMAEEHGWANDPKQVAR